MSVYTDQYSMGHDIRIREPAVAGRFYPDDRNRLLAILDTLCPATKTSLDDSNFINAVIVPHAGYEYAGETAAEAFYRVSPDQFKRAIIIGPSHYVGFHGISVAPFAQYRTPLGCINVDTAECDRIFHREKLFLQREDVHRHEHAIEVELPFIQKILPDCLIIPLVVGELNLDEIDRIAEILVDCWDEATLVVISSDFTHYGESFGYVPFNVQDAPAELEKLDRGAISRILEADRNGFLRYVEETGATICGRLPIAILLAMIEKSGSRAEIELLSYTNSGEILNDYTQSVSYAAISVAQALP